MNSFQFVLYSTKYATYYNVCVRCYGKVVLGVCKKYRRTCNVDLKSHK